MKQHLTGSRRGSSLAWPLSIALFLVGAAVDVAESGASIQHPLLLVVFMALAICVYLADQHNLPMWQLDAALAVALVALIVCGPLGALIVAAFPEPFRPWTERRTRTPRTIALVADTASFAWQAAIAYAVLRSVPGGHGIADSWPRYAVVGSTMVIVNVGVVWGLLQRLVDGKPWRPALRIIGSMVPIAFLAALTASLYTAVGMPALAAFAAIACLPGVIVRYATPILAPRAAQLDRKTATRRYADAIADALDLAPRRRRAIRLAAGHERHSARELRPGRLFDDRFRALELQFEVDRLTRHRDSRGVSLDACVLELAGAWAALTAAGTRELSHTAALTQLESETWHLSAKVLRAAWQVVNDQPIPAREHALAPSTKVVARRITDLAASVA